MAKQLRTLGGLAEDPAPVRIAMVCKFSAGRSSAFSWSPWALHGHGVQTYRKANTPTHKVKLHLRICCIVRVLYLLGLSPPIMVSLCVSHSLSARLTESCAALMWFSIPAPSLATMLLVRVCVRACVLDIWPASLFS